MSHSIIFAHDIRNLLILAATEVEMHCRGILVANGRSTERFTTKDYVKLEQPLRLSDYQIAFHRFPGLPPIHPFAGWRTGGATTAPHSALPWYEAYHAVKHDRENAFAEVTLGHMIAAVAACASLLAAQFGRNGLTQELPTFFKVTPPVWPIEQMYLAYRADGEWIARPHRALA